MTDESVLHLLYRYGLAINMIAIANSMFGRDVRRTALLTLLRGKLRTPPKAMPVALKLWRMWSATT
ncbi:hypothetical protein [Bradyrhizobium sp. B117]|uniref:hypothetical protein n=1 Tax=Bradyrhizobium sp. B117 TaxID=3140246 RepID=UPI0031830AC1